MAPPLTTARVPSAPCVRRSARAPRARVLARAAGAASHFKYVVLGGGNAAGYCAREFAERRGEGDQAGEMCILADEAVLPYERPALSKAYLFPASMKPPRLPGFNTCVGGGGDRQDAAWYKRNGIEFKTDAEVVDVDVEAKQLTTAFGDIVSYDRLVIATGARPLTLAQFGTPNADAENIAYLRNVKDADALVATMRRMAKRKARAVVVGGGYIGMECAAALVLNGFQVTMVFPEDYLMPRLFTPSLAEFYEKYYQGKGVEIIKGDLVQGFTKGDKGEVTAANLKHGGSLPCDLVVVGVGAAPNAELFQGKLDLAGKEAGGGVAVDSKLRASAPGVFAVGDVAAFPLKRVRNRKGKGQVVQRQEHVLHCRQSAAHAMRVAMSADPAACDDYDYVPYFYSRVFDLSWVFYGFTSPSGKGGKVQCVDFGDRDEGAFGCLWVDESKSSPLSLSSSKVACGVFLEGASPEQAEAAKQIAAQQPKVSQKQIDELKSGGVESLGALLGDS